MDTPVVRPDDDVSGVRGRVDRSGGFIAIELPFADRCASRLIQQHDSPSAPAKRTPGNPLVVARVPAARASAAVGPPLSAI